MSKEKINPPLRLHLLSPEAVYCCLFDSGSNYGPLRALLVTAACVCVHACVCAGEKEIGRKSSWHSQLGLNSSLGNH